jgi:rhodanese-related sulfurtransferase
MSARRNSRSGRAGVLGSALAALPLLVPAVSALTPAQVALAAAPRHLDLRSLAQAAARGDDEISPEHLRELMRARRADFTLIDIRTPEQFERGHIRGAVNVPLAGLLDPAELVRLRKLPQVIVYSTTSDKQAQATALLRVAGVPALGLAGGLSGWAHALDRWSGERENYAIVRALNECPQVGPQPMPRLQAAPGAPATTGAQPSAAPPAAPPAAAGKSRGRVNLKGMCS